MVLVLPLPLPLLRGRPQNYLSSCLACAPRKNTHTFTHYVVQTAFREIRTRSGRSLDGLGAKALLPLSEKILDPETATKKLSCRKKRTKSPDKFPTHETDRINHDPTLTWSKSVKADVCPVCLVYHRVAAAWKPRNVHDLARVSPGLNIFGLCACFFVFLFVFLSLLYFPA